MSSGDASARTRCLRTRDRVADLLKSAVAMAGNPVSPIPEHLGTVTPRLVVGDGAAALGFYRRAFGAEEIGERFSTEDGKLIHAEIRIGDSVVMITEVGDPAQSPDSLGGAATSIMATYWEDVDAAWERALAAGAEVIFPLADQFYGDRAGRVRDPFGHQWMMSQRISA
jgi:PhnB protein